MGGPSVNNPAVLATSREVAEAFAMAVVSTPELADRFAVCVLHTWPGRPTCVLAPESLSQATAPAPSAAAAPKGGAASEEPAPPGGEEDGQRGAGSAADAGAQPGSAEAAPEAAPPAADAAAAEVGDEGADKKKEEAADAEGTAGQAAKLPEPSSRPPLAPHIPSEAVRRAAKGKIVVLVPCTFEDEREAATAHQLMQNLKADAAPARVLMVQLFLPGAGPGPQTNDMLLRRHEAMLASMPHAVLVNPPTDARSLCDAIEIQCAVDEQSERRMQGALDAEVPAVSQEEIQTLRQEQERLLWNEIPSVLMQQLPHANPNLPEGLSSVSDLNFHRRLAARTGVVYEATRAANQDRFCVKIIEKEAVTSPGLLEGHYRELILLSRTLDHPNISKCLEVLHSQTRLYYVFRFAGSKNLGQVLENRTGWLLPSQEALHCFGQVCTGMAYCHERNVALRDLAAEHVVMRETEEEGVHWTLVDFRSSLITQGNNTSSVMCGSFPCMAPEVAAGQNYVPRSADRWSLGILLLEMAAGLGVMDAAVQWVGSAVDAVLAGRVTGYFREDDALEKIFALQKVTPENTILGLLKALVRVTPAERADLAGLLQGLGLGVPAAAAAAA